MMFEHLSRRGMLAGGLAGAARLAFPSGGRARRDPVPVLRLVHLTDVHVKADGGVPQKVARCFDKIRSVERPDVVIQGGDIIWDGCSVNRETAVAQYELADRLIRRHLGMPVTHCIGNHDVWGWKRPDHATLEPDPLYGKNMWQEWTGYPSTYFSFERANWHFVVLDSIQASSRDFGYEAHLDADQWRWLEDDLASVPTSTPICVISHAPFIHGGVQFLEHSQAHSKFWIISGSLLHLDARPFKDLLVRHSNVRLCLSGHIHMFSRVHYNGTSHIGNGAVSGGWWKGDMQETHPGYAVVDLFADGKVKSRFETY